MLNISDASSCYAAKDLSSFAVLPLNARRWKSHVMQAQGKYTELLAQRVVVAHVP